MHVGVRAAGIERDLEGRHSGWLLLLDCFWLLLLLLSSLIWLARRSDSKNGLFEGDTRWVFVVC